jgi:hypothetical protein
MNGKKMHRYLWKSEGKLPLIFMIAAITCLGVVLFHHVSLSSQAPIWDALGYAQKGKNFWDAIRDGKWFNPLNLEPSYRPPANVLMSYPFGFSENPHGFYFRSIFIPVVLFLSALWIIASPGCTRPGDRWLLMSLCLAFSTMPLFYHFERNASFWSPGYWGLVDNFLASMAALAIALTVRGVKGGSYSFTFVGIVASSFCLLVKPVGAVVMGLIFFVWAVNSFAQYRPLHGGLKHNDKGQRYMIVSACGFIVIYGTVVLLSFGSHYLSSYNIAFGKRAVELLREEWAVRNWWATLRMQIRFSFGWHWIAFVFGICGVSLWLRFRRPHKWYIERIGSIGFIDLLSAAGVLLTGIWFWTVASGNLEIRYFFPFALMGITVIFPRIIFICTAISVRFRKVMCGLLLFPFAMLFLLLIPNNAPFSFQHILGVNLTSGSLGEEVKQAESLVDHARLEKKDLVVYLLTVANPAGVFAGVGWYAKMLKPSQYSFGFTTSVDWEKGSAIRFSDIISSDYLAFEPMADSAMRKAILGRHEVSDLWSEQQLFRAWLTGAGEMSGLKTESETSLRLVKIVDKVRLEDSLMRLKKTYRWRKAFLDANPVKWISGERVESLISDNKRELRDIRFGEAFLLMGLSTEDTGDGLKLNIVWKSLKEQPLRYINFVHLVDSAGMILAQADYIQDGAKRVVGKGTTWHDVVMIPKAKLIGAEAIGIGIYLPPDEFLIADQGPRDWNGRRLLIRVK